MQTWTLLHILAMFAAVTFAWGGELFVVHAIRRRDIDALRAYDRLADRIDGIGGILAIVGIAFGFVAAIVGGLDLLQGWLVLAYVLVGIALVTGIASLPYHGRLREAVRANVGQEPSPELERLLGSPIAYAYAVVGLTLVTAIIWVMVVKPSI